MGLFKDPQSLSMESLIFYADGVLDTILQKHAKGGGFKRYFQNCAAIVIVQSVDVGLIYSGSVGSGILFVKNETMEGDDTSSFVWSRPVACIVDGVGFGLSLGGAGKDLLIFLPNRKTVDTFITDGMRMGGKAQATLGVGRETGWTFGSEGGVSTFAFTKGAFVSLALEGNAVACQPRINNRFYFTGVDPFDIVDKDSDKVSLPKDKETLLPEVYIKLALLCGGDESIPPTPEEMAASQADPEKQASAKEAAVKADQEIVEDKSEEVVEVGDPKTETVAEETKQST